MSNLSLLRSYMKNSGIACSFFVTGDCHGSEYFCSHFDTIKYISGFSGSNAQLVVFMDKAMLWTDGRYFIQAEKELKGSGIELMRSGMPGVKNVTECLGEKLEGGMRLAIDGMVVSTSLGQKIEAVCKRKGCEFCAGIDVNAFWKDRPQIPCGNVVLQRSEISGEGISNKIARVRCELKRQGVDAYFTAALDEVMWLFNIRGNDVLYNPVALSYAYVSLQKAVLFIQSGALSDENARCLCENDIEIRKYEEVDTFLCNLTPEDITVLIDPSSAGYSYFKALESKEKRKIKSGNSVIEPLKAVKNETEIRNLEEYFLRDSAAVVKFLYWLDKEAVIGEVTECEAASKLRSFRSEIPGYLMDSFETISAYGANAAMAHYEPSNERPVVINNRGFLLVDSGGQYECATTDVTRTSVVGPLTDDERMCFTFVAMGMLRLMNAVFPEGCSGRNLDILARLPLWNKGLDFRHGTGHGVGCCLSVHEGPQAIRWKPTSMSIDGILRPGMLITDEPGMYVEDSFGIRTENTLLVVKRGETEYGQFLCFRPMTLAPIDIRGLDVSLMTDEDINYLNDYHCLVYDSINGFLDADEAEWLKKMTKPVYRQ